MRISIPADFKEATLLRARDISTGNSEPILFEVYGSLPDSGFAAGRSSSVLPHPSRAQFEAYLHLAQISGITFNYTLNGSCLGSLEYDTAWRLRLGAFLDDLSSLGIVAFTVSTPALVAIIRHQLPNARITVSITADVRTPQAVNDYVSVGANRVMASVWLLRRFKLLHKLTTIPGVEIGMLLNSFCFPDCTYRSEHFNTSSHLTGTVPDLYSTVGSFDFNQCALAKLTDPALFLRTAWVRPEDVSHYENAGVSFFKIEGRQRQTFDAVRVASVYSGRHFDGNLCCLHSLYSDSRLPQLINIENHALEGFLDRFVSGFTCEAGNCKECGHCADYASRAITVSDPEALARAIARVRSEISAFITAGDRINEAV